MPKPIQTSSGVKYMKTSAETGKILESLRKSANITGSEFARRLGITPSQYHYIEKGRYEISLKVLTVLRQSDIDIDQFLIPTKKEIMFLNRKHKK